MTNRSKEEFKEEISLRKSADKKKLKFLGKVAMLGLIIRLLIYLLPYEPGGLLIEMLWAPLILLILALPFYAFEKLLDRI